MRATRIGRKRGGNVLLSALKTYGHTKCNLVFVRQTKMATVALRFVTSVQRFEILQYKNVSAKSNLRFLIAVGPGIQNS